MISVELARRLKYPFAICVTLLTGVTVYWSTSTPISQIGCGVLIATAAMLPFGLWTSARTPGGLPIFPTAASTFVGTHALPFFTDHRSMDGYADEAKWYAAITVASFLLTGTGMWWLIVSTKRANPLGAYFGWQVGERQTLHYAFLLSGCVFHTSIWQVVLPDLSAGMYSAIRAGCLSLALLGTCTLAFTWGQGVLRPTQKLITVILVTLYSALDMGGLIIHGTVSLMIAAVVTYTLGRGRPPIVLPLIAILLFSVLHMGKWPMRAQYWAADKSSLVQEDFIQFYCRWFSYGIEESVRSAENSDVRPSGKPSTSVERASIVQMLLLVQSQTPNSVPYLYGATYSNIHELLIPRVLHTNKPEAREGSTQLSITYGLQTRESAKSTSIAFGIVAEAYANFGILGVIALGATLGLFSGWAANLSRELPITAVRSLWGFLCMSVGLNTEGNLGVLASTLAQSSILLFVLAALTMRTVTHPARLEFK